jgi:hypothetical protein
MTEQTLEHGREASDAPERRPAAERDSATAREHTAERLLRSSLRTQYDPIVEIDWDAPLLPDAFWIPPERSSLYGTELWERLTHEQRVELTKHETASAASTGVWFETMLIQMLARQYYDQDPTSRHAQYALTEIADECRHSIMFGKLIERLGCPPYAATPWTHNLGRILKTTARGAHMYSAILIAEEILDAFQREIMNDDPLQPLIRMVSRIHVVEEARHIKWAAEELDRQVASAGRLEMAYSSLVIGRAAYVIAGRLSNPAVYAAVGIDPREGWAAARANPYWQATLRWAGKRIHERLNDAGLVKGAGRMLWQRAGLT